MVFLMSTKQAAYLLYKLLYSRASRHLLEGFGFLVVFCVCVSLWWACVELLLLLCD